MFLFNQLYYLDFIPVTYTIPQKTKLDKNEITKFALNRHIPDFIPLIRILPSSSDRFNDLKPHIPHIQLDPAMSDKGQRVPPNIITHHWHLTTNIQKEEIKTDIQAIISRTAPERSVQKGKKQNQNHRKRKPSVPRHVSIQQNQLQNFVKSRLSRAACFSLPIYCLSSFLRQG